jgi:hypothetical protein
MDGDDAGAQIETVVDVAGNLVGLRRQFRVLLFGSHTAGRRDGDDDFVGVHCRSPHFKFRQQINDLQFGRNLADFRHVF